MAHPPGELERAEDLVARGRTREARDLLAERLRRDPGNDEARALYHATNAALGDESFEDAERAVREIVAAGPASASVAMEAAWLRFRKGEREEAIAELRALSAAHPDDGELHQALGNCLLLTDRAAEAWTEYQAALRLGAGSLSFGHLVNALHAARLAGATRGQVADAARGIGVGTRLRAQAHVGPWRWALYSLPVLGVACYLAGLVTGSIPATAAGGLLVVAFGAIGGTPRRRLPLRILEQAAAFGALAVVWFLSTGDRSLTERSLVVLVVICPVGALFLVPALRRRRR